MNQNYPKILFHKTSALSRTTPTLLARTQANSDDWLTQPTIRFVGVADVQI